MSRNEERARRGGKRPNAPGADFLNALFATAIEHHQRGRLAEAEAIYRQILAADPDHLACLQYLGTLALQSRRPQEAVELLGRALALNDRVPGLHNNMGLAFAALGHFEDAASHFRRAVELAPNFIDGFIGLGNALAALKRNPEAIAQYRRALEFKPDNPRALYNLGNVLREEGNLDEAVAAYRKARALVPGSVEILVNLAAVLKQQEQFDEALQCLRQALALSPQDASAHINMGNLYVEQGRFDEAIAHYMQALRTQPDSVDGKLNLGHALIKQGRPAEALAPLQAVLTVNPNHPQAWISRGAALSKMLRHEEALADFDRALSLDPNSADALYNRAEVLGEMRRLDDALVCYERARAINPNHQNAFGMLDLVTTFCDWRRTETILDEAIAALKNSGGPVLPPFLLLFTCDDPELHLQCATKYIKHKLPIRPAPLANRTILRRDKIRLAYLSADFREHPVAQVMAQLLEGHDRSRFEVMGISFGPDDGSGMRARLQRAFDQFIDVHAERDGDIARLLHGREVDIAIDLMGYTLHSRPEILGFRPAPIQVNYLGYAGTLAADFIDYVIADPVVLPYDQQPFYTERIVHLPDCYLPYDTGRKVAERKQSRADAGLPEQGFVFCSFNNSFKIMEPIFSLWMRLLHRVDGSVLWLRQTDPHGEANLRSEARARGIDPARLVFAGRCEDLEDHLARHRLADLFLDTLPYNAHSTASDALWAGLPLLTCRGKAFAGRVAASLLQAVGLPELVTETLADYEALALRLATDATLLADIRAKLARGRETEPLFDADCFRGHMESAYATMWEIWQRGERPRNFAVTDLREEAR